MPDQTLVVKIIGDDRALKQTLTSSTRAVKRFDSDVGRLGRGQGVNQGLRGALTGLGSRSSLLFGSGAFISTAAVTAGVQKSVSAASDLNEQVSKSRQIFGEASRSIEDWAQTTAASMGISERAALSATGIFGNLFATVDLAPAQAAEMSQALVKLAGDLASFNNASPEEVLTAIRSGLIGEAEPLRRYGVLLSEARVQQQAMADTGKTNVKSLTDQEKALARYRIILEDTGPAQGDFARTSGGLANQSRILRANLDDLAANVGGILIPTLVEAAEAANLLFIAFDKFRGIPDNLGIDFPDLPDWLSGSLPLAPISPLGAVAIAIKKALEDQQAPTLGRPPGTLGGLASSAAAREADEQKQVEKAKRSLERSKRQFAEFVKGLGLKFDKAGLTASLDDDLSALREIESAIERQIAREGKTFKLVDQLTQVRLQITSTIAQSAAIGAQRARDAAQAARDEASAAKELAQAMRDARQGRQFEALGLTAEGEGRAPGVGALQQRLRSLRDQVKGTALDTDKTRSQLRRIAKVLAGEFGAVGRDVRNAILQMFKDISDALDQGGTSGPLTKTTSLNSKKLLAGIGLSPEEIRELRGRLSNFNSAGFAVAGGAVGAGSGGGVGAPVVVESHTTINLDGQKVAAVVTRNQQKTKRRNPKQKRGPNRKR